MATPLQLHNEQIEIAVLPDEGACVGSLRSVLSGLEFLLQPERATRPVDQGREANFADSRLAGIDECLPTVSRCEVGGETIPDHGDFWQLNWQVHNATEHEARLDAEGFSQPLRYEKTLSLEGSCLRIHSLITNVGTGIAHFLYASHPLLAVDAGDVIVLPAECGELTLHSSLAERLGRGGIRVAWPLVKTKDGGVDLSCLEGINARTAEMLYTDRLREGWCGLYRARHWQGVVVRFDPKLLPYMGLWICCGGWPTEGSGPYQYAFAPEPTTAPCGSLAEAIDRHMQCELPAGEDFSFAIEFRLSPPGLSLAEFREFAGA